jgi:tetratricopeptide (TPR) repeat protein
MKKIVFGGLGLLFLLFSTQGISQNKSSADVKKVSEQSNAANLKTMTWTSSSDAAKQLAFSGAEHFLNVETEQAYADFEAALKLDPDFTVALVFMTRLTTGATQKSYAARAIKSAANKTEGEKLFASLTDENNTGDKAREIIEKLHSMFPDGGMLATLYVMSRSNIDEQYKSAQELLKQFPQAGMFYNIIGYYYMQKRDYPNAKKSFEKYIELYPEGANPYDSMGEYYLTVGDNENAEKYYGLALEKYPLLPSSVQAMEKIKTAKDKTKVK